MLWIEVESTEGATRQLDVTGMSAAQIGDDVEFVLRETEGDDVEFVGCVTEWHVRSAASEFRGLLDGVSDPATVARLVDFVSEHGEEILFTEPTHQIAEFFGR